MSRTKSRSALTSRPRYEPQDTRDVAGERAAFEGRVANGRVTAPDSGATAALRAKLPRGRDVFQTFKREGGEGIARAVRQADQNEDARQEQLRAQAEADYQAYLDRRGSLATEDDPGDDEGQGDAGSPDFDSNFRQLEAEAETAAARIREAIVAPTEVAGRRFEMPIHKAQYIPPTPAPAPVPQTGVLARAVTVEDVDRLWDWIRADVGVNVVTPFLGRAFPTSIALHQYMAQLTVPGEARAMTLAIRSLYGNGRHLGFFMLSPIDRAANVAFLHQYLAPEMRGEILNLAPYVFTGAREIIGPKMQLGIYGAQLDEKLVRFISQYGFKSHVTFLQAGSSGT